MQGATSLPFYRVVDLPVDDIARHRVGDRFVFCTIEALIVHFCGDQKCYPWREIDQILKAKLVFIF